MKQPQGHASGCKYTVEVKRDDPAQIQKREQSVSKPVEQITKEQPIPQSIEQKKGDVEDKTQKPKRPRKTIEQELAELEQRKAKLLEAKRKNETREKIIFGATVIAMLSDMKKNNDKNFTLIKDKIQVYAKEKKLKDGEIIHKVISNL